MRTMVDAIIVGCIYIILMTSMSQAAVAGSFNLFPSDAWVYDDLALLADSKLLSEYANAQELVDVFPLARYEVAMLVGDLLAQAEGGLDIALDVSIPPADVLMMRILESQASGDTVRLSGGTVAMARVNSEAALKALNRLAHEFAEELEILGVDHAWLMSFDRGTQNSLALRGELDLRITPLGPTIWRTYGMSTKVAAAPQISDDTARDNEGVSYVGPISPMTLGESTSDANHDHTVELSILLGKFDVCDETLADIYQYGDSLKGIEVADGSLKLQPSMAERRPVGLLSSYFADFEIR